MADEELLTEDMTEKELAEGMEDALEGERERTERRLDREGAEGGDDDAGPDDDADEDLDDDEDLGPDDDEGEDFDDDDEDLDEDEEDEKGSGPDRGDGRDKKGKFAGKDGEQPDDKKGDTAPDKKPVAGADKPVAGDKPGDKPDAAADAKAGARAAGWEPYRIKADKGEHDIPEAVGIQRRDGHVFIAIPEGKFDAYNRRVGLGIVAERRWRDLEQQIKGVQAYEKELKEKSENPEPTKDAIEAQVWLQAIKGEGPYAQWQTEEGKSRIRELFEPWQLDILERDVKIALSDAQTAHRTKAEERRTAEQKSVKEDETYDQGLRESIALLQEEDEKWLGIPVELLRQAYAELKPMMRNLLGANDDGSLYVTEHGAQIIRRVLRSYAADAPAAAPTKPDASKDAKPGEGTGDAKGDRFNKGQDSAKKPPTTSVKDRRDDRDRSRRGNRDDRRNRGRRRRDNRTEAQRDEDRVRKETKNWLRSPTLEMPD